MFGLLYLIELKAQEFLAASQIFLLFNQCPELLFQFVKLCYFGAEAVPQVHGMAIGIQEIQMILPVKER
jgi:hypothetical protein